MRFMVLHGLRTLNEPYPLAAPAAGSTGRAASQHAMPKQKLTDASLRALRPGQTQIDWCTLFAASVSASRPAVARRSWCATASGDATGA